MTKGKRRAKSSKSWQANAKEPKIEAAQHQESKPSVDEKGYMICRAGNLLTDRYNIEEVLGEGAFGRVVRVKDMDTLKSKAVKIFKNEEYYLQGAYCEIRVLQLIAEKDPNETSGCIKILDWFVYHNHACIVFDVLGMSVYDYIKHNNFKPYSVKEVRHIAYQLCSAVKFLHTNGITHTDIKPENVLLVDSSTLDGNRRLKSTEIRLIDFGGATLNAVEQSSITTTQYYRAPELVLKLGWQQSSDSWSIACTIFELCFARILFPSDDDDLHHLLMMEAMLGPIPYSMASKTERKFFIDGKLNCNEELDDEYLDICDRVKGWIIDSEDSDLGNLMKQMLTYDPTERITVEIALKHPFFEDMLPIVDQK